MENRKKYVSILTLPGLDEVSEKEAKVLFSGYKSEKIVRAGQFEDDDWVLCDEYSNVGFHFHIDDNDFKSFGEKINMRKDEFVLYMKIYAIYRLGELALRTIQEVIYGIRRVVKNNSDELKQAYKIQFMGRLAEFFSLLPKENREDALDGIVDDLECIEDEIRGTEAGVRKLAAFESYFLFGDLLDKFWKEADEEDKLFFFPVYLWWHMSGVIPMRPREFILTPRDFLRGEPGKWFIKVLKNKVKGSDRPHAYKIIRDYETATYEIPDGLAQEISWYIARTEDFGDNELSTLLRVFPHYEKWGRSQPYTSRFYTYANLSTCLRYFFEEIIHERYGYKIVFERDGSRLKEGEIHYLHLGDTRHLSMINIIAEGGTPAVAAILAGHESINMAAHYFRDITELIECNVHRKYKRLKNGEQTYSIQMNRSAALPDDEYLEMGDGRCYSANAMRGDYSDCMKMISRNGEIGTCDSCPFFRRRGHAFKASENLYKGRIEAECKELVTIVNKVRKMNGNEEDIIQAVLRLKNAEYSYQQYLMETMGGDET